MKEGVKMDASRKIVMVRAGLVVRTSDEF